jgi:ATP-dependent DNA helicase RecQ
MANPTEILKEYWGYSKFRSPQLEIINTVLANKDCIVLLPTGGGKSICFQVPTLIFEGVCIVISPLIALMEDQVQSLTKIGVKAIALNSQLNQNELINTFDNIQFGKIKFLFLSPEKLQSQFIQDKIRQLNVSLVAIDEAHCISEWGHDFRPSYLKLDILKELTNSATCIALTATATEQVLADIKDKLGLSNPKIFKKSYYRNNLVFRVIKTDNIYNRLINLISKINGSVIVYAGSRRETKEVSHLLQKNNIKSDYYHGGLSIEDKQQSYQNWMQNISKVMVATNAFGMGIDKPDVRAVIHINIPQSIENFIQESGRAGRDEKMAYSIILSSEYSIQNSRDLLKNSTPSLEFLKQVYFNLNQNYRIAIGELPNEEFDFILPEFSATYKTNLIQTYNAIKILERESILKLDENFRKKSTLRILISNKQAINYTRNNSEKNKLVQLILRSYGGIFDSDITINETFLAKKFGKIRTEVIKLLNELNKDKIIDYNYQNVASKLTFLVPREDNHTLNLISKRVQQQNELKINKLEAIILYITNQRDCRNEILLSYFGEKLNELCGTCDY